jgi:TrmH family RNA methyltransferase
VEFREPVLITSAQNERLKEVIRLRERRHRDESTQFLIEGYRELFRSVSKAKIEVLFFCPELFLGVNEPALIDQLSAKGAHLFRCSESAFRKISYRDRPDGLLAIARQQPQSLDDLDRLIANKKSPFLVVAEAIEKPGNLGTILRSSDAVGVDGLIVCDRCTDIYNPNVVRASVGTLFTVPVVESEGEETLQWLRQRGIAIVAATPSAKHEFTQVDLKGPVAIAVGTEQLGLSERWMKHADIQVRIPMNGVADSLNVAMATTLLLYEALRQRSL